MVARTRLAVPDDAAAIAGVHVRSWQAAYRGLMPDELLDGLSVEQRTNTWVNVLNSEAGTTVYVAVEDSAVAGFCAVTAPTRDGDSDGDTAEIAAIYVEPGVWRKGHGRALMDVALTELRAGDWSCVSLWVLAENHQARSFYNRLGFEPDGAETTHVRSGQKEVRLRSRITTSGQS